MKKNILVASIFLLITACSDPTLDASSDEAFRTSLEKISRSLSPEQQAQLRNDVSMLAMQSVDFGALLQGEQTDVERNMRTQFDGKTASEVMSEAARVRAERDERERQQGLSEIEELLEKKQRAEIAKQQLAKFKVLRSRFYKQSQRFGDPEPIIVLELTNGTPSAISRAYFQGTLASPGRQIPWLKETFNYQVPGGIEPGETASWSLAPNRFSEWGKVRVPEDAVLTVEPYRLDGPDGEALYDATGLGEHEQARLERLQERFGGI